MKVEGMRTEREAETETFSLAGFLHKPTVSSFNSITFINNDR